MWAAPGHTFPCVSILSKTPVPVGRLQLHQGCELSARAEDVLRRPGSHQAPGAEDDHPVRLARGGETHQIGG
jgi:hypothetical protein